MKYLVLFTFLTCIVIPVSAQLKVKTGSSSTVLAESNYMGKKAAELSTYLLPTGDTAYALGFRDSKYTYVDKWDSFVITGRNNMKEFFDLVKKMYKEKKGKDEEYTIEVAGGKEVNLRWMGPTVIAMVKGESGAYSSFPFHTNILKKLDVL